MSQKNDITFVFIYTNFFTKKGGGDFFLSRFTLLDFELETNRHKAKLDGEVIGIFWEP